MVAVVVKYKSICTATRTHQLYSIRMRVAASSDKKAGELPAESPLVWKKPFLLFYSSHHWRNVDLGCPSLAGGNCAPPLVHLAPLPNVGIFWLLQPFCSLLFPSPPQVLVPLHFCPSTVTRSGFYLPRVIFLSVDHRKIGVFTRFL